MNATTVGSRVRRSPSTSRRNSREDVSNPEAMGATHVDMLMPRVVVSGTRQRHHTGGGDSATQEDLARLGRSGSWGGVNESEEDMAAKMGVGKYTPIKIDSKEEEEGNTSWSEQTPVNGDVRSHQGEEQQNSVRDRGRQDLDDPEEEDFRRRLAFFFFDPVQKYKARKQFPWKLALQFLKIILVTVQIIIFGSYRYAHTRYFEDNRVALEHLFLRNWDSVREINAYPPATGVFALYRKDDFYTFFDHAVTTYDGVEGATINPVFKDGGGISFCVDSFGDGTVFPNLTWTIDFGHLEYRHDCIKLPEDKLANFSSKQYLQDVGFEVPWSTMSEMKLNFTLNTLTYTKFGPLLGPECFAFSTEIVFSNSDYDGQMPISLELRPHRQPCPDPLVIPTSTSTATRCLNYMVTITCVASFILCLRALIRGQRLRREAERVFFRKYQWTLTHSERMNFLNGWYVVIIINDVLIIAGCLLKEMMESRQTFEDLWDYCSVFLGTGNLLVWIGMLRYLGFFKTYNVLILTMKGAVPNVMRFLLCGGLIYFGFVFCGWIILGPYNFKFKTILTTSECLFSLINGDDMFATFSSVPQSSGLLVWYFSKIYLYLFICLFIYVVLSLFIAIIMDTYEVIKECYDNGFPRDRIMTYCDGGKYDPESRLFREEEVRGSEAEGTAGRGGAAIFRRLFGISHPVISRVIRRRRSSAAERQGQSNGTISSNDRNPLVT